MNLQYRIDLLSRLGEYILSSNPEWEKAREKASAENGWFTPEFIDKAATAVATRFLQKDLLRAWAEPLHAVADNGKPSVAGIVMAGNIPLVGFHDWLTVFISGHHAVIKPSARDQALITHLLDVLASWEPAVKENTRIADMLKGCDAYIATGSNNSSRYFQYYFGKFPHIIRTNRTSAAVLTGQETQEELEKLADDVCLYFGLGCRNVTKIYVPEGYDFIPLLGAMNKYSYLGNHHKYKNNYDYNLALHLLNKVQYMTNGHILLVEDEPVFSPISQLNYSYYTDKEKIFDDLGKSGEIQCIAGSPETPFGTTQQPALADYADGVNTLQFMTELW